MYAHDTRAAAPRRSGRTPVREIEERDGPTQRMSLLFDLLPPRDYLLQTRASQIRQRPLAPAARRSRENSCYYYDRAFFERSIHIHSSVSESNNLILTTLSG